MDVYIDLQALQHNVNTIKKSVGDKHIAIVVKSDAYGHDVTLVVPSLLSFGIERYIVSNVEEAYKIWNLGARWILVLHLAPSDILEISTASAQFKQAVRVVVWDFDFLASIPADIPVHLAFSLGFGIGIDYTAMQLPLLKDKNIEGLMGHIPFLEDTEDHQLLRKKIYKDFMDISEYYIKKLDIRDIHLCNSSSLFYLDGCSGTSMIRTGVAVYGYIETETVKPLLNPVMYQLAPIIAVKNIRKGDTVFYGNIAEKDMKIAFVRAGYGDGYVGAKYVYHLKSGNYVPRVFDLTMNVSAIDVSDVDVKNGDTVLLLGHHEKVRADIVASMIGLSTEKILTKAGLSQRKVLPQDIRDLLLL